MTEMLRIRGISARAAAVRGESESGQALIEFALFAALFLTIVVGVTDLSFYILGVMAVEECATEGVSYGSAPGNQNDNSGMVLWANQASFGASLTSYPTSQTFFTCSPGGGHVAATTVCPGNVAPMEYVQVTATTALTPIFKAVFLNATNVSTTATFRVEWHQ